MTSEPMTRRLRALLRGALTLTAAALLAAPVPAQTWIRHMNEPGDAFALALREDGLSAVARQTGVSLFDAAGELVASYDLATYDGSELLLFDARFLDDGTLAVAGSSDRRPWVAALQPLTGLPVWETTLTDDEEGHILRMVVNDLGHLVLQGYLIEAADLTQFVADVNPATGGGTHYRRLYGSGFGSSLSVTQSGDIVLASHDGDLTLTRASNWTNPIWRKRYDSVANFTIPMVAEAPDGDLLTMGVFDAGDEYEFYAMRTDADGEVIWRRGYASYPVQGWGWDKHVKAVRALPDGGLVAAVGQPMPPAGDFDGALLRLDADGNLLWLRPFGEDGHEFAVDVELTPDGGFLVLVNNEDGGLRLVRLDADGQAGPCVSQTMGAYDLPLPAVTVVEEDFAYTNFSSLQGQTLFTPVPHGAPLTTVCATPCSTSGTTYGSGTAGSGGQVPALSVSDGVCLGWTPRLEIAGVLGQAPGLALVSFGAGSLPALGGTVWLDPAQILVIPIAVGGPAGVPGAGSASYPLGTDLTALAGFSVHVQTVFADGAGPTGKVLSNAVSVSVQ